MVQKRISRRDFLKDASLAVSGAVVLPRINRMLNWGTKPPPQGFRFSGNEVPGLESFDQMMIDYIKAREIPCGSLAVARNGKLIFARGYNYKDPFVPDVEPTSLFRIASISKPITGVAVMRLVQDGLLSLDDLLVTHLTLQPIEGQTADPRLGSITIRNLLQHQGGWDRSMVPDPMFQDWVIAETLGKEFPITQEDIMAYVTGQPLQHDPGTKYAYSNYGYLLLGRIIEKVTGKDYSAYVQEAVYTPLGITRMVQGRSLLEDRFETEVPYSCIYKGKAVFPGVDGNIFAPDGTFNLEVMEAHGAWLASTVDLVKFCSSIHSPDGNPVLNEASKAEMFARPAASFDGSPWWYADGWLVRKRVTDGLFNYWHDGSLPGTIALMVHRYDGLDWAVLFNQRDDQKDKWGETYWAIDGLLHKAADAVKTANSWPADDYDEFPNYFA